MMKLRSGKRLGGILALTCLGAAAACKELNEPVPGPLAPLPPSGRNLFNIAGHWEALTDQGRRVAFDVTPEGVVINGRINVHHDCSTGRLRLTLDGYHAEVTGDSFTANFPYRINDNGRIYVIHMTITGRFESEDGVRGGFVSSITDKPTDDGFGVCLAANGTFDGYKER